ncbi:MAG TPA: hypothetical protein VGE97_09410 [Nitrososphaera sp.]|jgi:hypothetical protein
MDVVAKAKRRIKRFLATGEHQARVHETQWPNILEYKVKHHSASLMFKADKLGRLRQII